MKKKVKIKDEYNIRIKKRILREIKDSEKKFVTTYKEIKKYFKIFNNKIISDYIIHKVFKSKPNFKYAWK